MERGRRDRRMTRDGPRDGETSEKLVDKRVRLAVPDADAWRHLVREARFCGQVATVGSAVSIDPALDGKTGFACRRT